MRKMAAALGLSIAAASGVAANDSVAMLTAGGLQLQQTADVRIESEDLVISSERISVDYVFENVSGANTRLTLAFPLPPVEARMVEGFDVANRETPRFIDFSTTVDGVPVEATEHVQIFAEDGRDVTEVFTRLNLPLTPFAEALAPWNEIPEAIAVQLRRFGLLVPDDYGYDERRWTVHVSYIWELSIGAGQSVEVHHEYRPISGGYFPPYYEGQWSGDYEGFYRERYCAGDGEWQTLNRMAEAGFLVAYETGYLLTPGANWAGPIGHFRLTIDKGAAENMVSLCWSDGITRIAPTLFSFEAEDYTPHQDIDMIVFEMAAD